jgi:hypothetical protein
MIIKNGARNAIYARDYDIAAALAPSPTRYTPKIIIFVVADIACLPAPEN